MRKRMFSASGSRGHAGARALRWMMLLPTSVVAAVIAYVAVSVMWSAAVYAAGGQLPVGAAAGSFAASFAMAYTWVATGVWVAPAQRAAAAQAMIGIGAAVAAIALYDTAHAADAVSLLAPGSTASSCGFLAGLAAFGLRLRHAVGFGR